MIICAFRLISETSKVLLSARSAADVVTRVLSVGDPVEDEKPEMKTK